MNGCVREMLEKNPDLCGAYVRAEFRKAKERNRELAGLLSRCRQGFLNLAELGALPNEHWDKQATDLAEEIREALERHGLG